MASKKTGGGDVKEEKIPDKPPRSKKAKCCRCLFWTGSVLVAAVAIFLGLFWRVIFNAVDIPVEVIESIGDNGIQMFFAHDRDGDGYLSLKEYESLYLMLKGQDNNVRNKFYLFKKACHLFSLFIFHCCEFWGLEHFEVSSPAQPSSTHQI